MDPLASEFPGYSPYNYVLGNPLKFIDPDGCAPEGEGDDPFLMARLVKTMFYDTKHSIENIVMNAFVPHDDGMKWQADYAKDVNGNQKFETIIQQVPSQGALQDGASLALDGVNILSAGKLNANDILSSKTGTNQIVKEAKAVVHGNSKLSPKETFLYEKYDKNGNFEKHGITSKVPSTKRYTPKEIDGGQMKVTDSGSRSDMLKKERHNVETNPGPKNKVRLAGSKQNQ